MSTQIVQTFEANQGSYMEGSRKALHAGTKLGNFEVGELLGVGGMGEVYLARDSKLGREVAIKVLPEEFSRDTDRLERFEREARTLASINHPNIAVLHGLESQGDTNYLVMELVPGKTLEERLKSGPIPMDEALSVFVRIAEGLEAAHEQGIVHRDLKPANVKITEEGRVKILDFGLDKRLSIASSSTLDEATQPWPAPTDITSDGMILGTPSYMSPEQARGRPVDKRTDIWAFGCCLYESLTGKRPFEGETASDTLAKILESEPDLKRLPGLTPPSLRTLLRRCLEKDPVLRLRDIGDARIELSDVTYADNGERAQRPHTERLVKHWLGISWPWVLVATLLLLFLWLLFNEGRLGPVRDGSPTLSVLAMPLPEGVTLDTSRSPINFDVSPDGSQVVFTGRRSNGTTELFLRSLQQWKSRPVRNTLDAINPFFSDDGKSLGYCTGPERPEIRTVLLGGSEHKSVAAAPFIHGADWGSGKIVFCSGPARGLGLTQVEAEGGPAQELTKPDVNRGAYNHFFPQILPDEKGILYTVSHGELQDGRIIAQSALDPDRVEFVATGSYGRYVSSGHVIYGKAGSLWAVPFDMESFEVTGPETEVVSEVLINPFFNIEVFAVSEGGNGTLVYAEAASRNFGRRLAWIDLEQRTLEYVSHAPADAYGNRVALRQVETNLVALVTIGRSRSDVWIQQLDRPGRQNLTPHPLADFEAIWSRSGEFVYFSSDRNGLPDIFRMRADGGGDVVSIVRDENRVLFDIAISPDDSTLAYTSGVSNLTGDIWIYDLGKSERSPWKNTDAYEAGSSFSPRGDWIAYQSKQSGADGFDVFISPLSDPQRVIHIAAGEAPLWHPDGDRIYYRHFDDLMMMYLDRADGFRPLDTEKILSMPAAAKNTPPGSFSYDITPDGKRILIIMEDFDIPELKQLVVVQNWFEELQRLVPID
ncbi:MAG: protein kinase [bacterium]|nr:protein kinase [bacterium]